MDIVLFRTVFNNRLLNQIIFKQVHHIFIDIFKRWKTFKWNEVIQSTSILAGNGYLDQLKQYYKTYNIKKFYSDDNFTVIEIIKSKRLDILKFIIEELEFNYQTLFDISSYHISNSYKSYHTCCDMLFVATFFGSFEIIKYLETLVKYNKNNDNNDNNSNKKNNNTKEKDILWNYAESMIISPYSNDIEIVKYLNLKIDLKVVSYTHRNFIYECIEIALKLGRIDMFEYLKDYYKPEIRGSNFAKLCIDSGKLEVLQYYLSIPECRKSVSKEALIDIAMRKQHIDMVMWLHENSIGTATNVAMDQAACLNLDLVKWFHENRTEGCSSSAMNNAAYFGHLDIVEWLHHNRTEGCTTNAMDNAGGYLELLKWLHHNRTEGCTTKAMNEAAKNGHLETIQWLHYNRTEGCTIKAMDDAAEFGHLETVQWLHHNRTEGCTTHAMDYAVFYQKLDVFKWLHENRTEGHTSFALSYAASRGDLEMLKYMHSNGIRGILDNPSSKAAAYGNLNVIKWMHENKVCQFSSSAMDNAAENGHLEIIKWLHENRTERCSEHIFSGVVREGQLKVLQWLLENQYQQYFNKSRIERINRQQKNMETIRWLKDNKLID